MNDAIYIKSGEKGDREKMPTLRYNDELGSEMGYSTDEKALYIGTPNGNERLCGVGDFSELYAMVGSLQAQVEEIKNRLPSE
jgi:hypothetical protein